VTRADLGARIVEATGWSRAASDRALRSMLAALRAALKRG
jgi:nucleoid DNA-binding protein